MNILYEYLFREYYMNIYSVRIIWIFILWVLYEYIIWIFIPCVLYEYLFCMCLVTICFILGGSSVLVHLTCGTSLLVRLSMVLKMQGLSWGVMILPFSLCTGEPICIITADHPLVPVKCACVHHSLLLEIDWIPTQSWPLCLSMLADSFAVLKRIIYYTWQLIVSFFSVLLFPFSFPFFLSSLYLNVVLVWQCKYKFWLKFLVCWIWYGVLNMVRCVEYSTVCWIWYGV